MRKISILLLFSLIAIFLTLFYKTQKLEDSLPLRKFEIATNKPTYFSGESVRIMVSIDANKKRNATLMLYGIPLPSGILLFKNVSDVELRAGTNLFTYNFSLPTCYTCVGLKSGKYEITAMAFLEDRTFNLTKEINLVE